VRPLQGKAKLCRWALCPSKSDNAALRWFHSSETGSGYIAQANDRMVTNCRYLVAVIISVAVKIVNIEKSAAFGSGFSQNRKKRDRKTSHREDGACGFHHLSVVSIQVAFEQKITKL
jgi:hypothetical protein